MKKRVIYKDKKDITVRVHYGDKDINQCIEDILPMLVAYINEKAGRVICGIRENNKL